MNTRYVEGPGKSRTSASWPRSCAESLNSAMLLASCGGVCVSSDDDGGDGGRSWEKREGKTRLQLFQ